MNEMYIYLSIKYYNFERIYYFHEKLGDKIIIYYYDMTELYKLKNKKVKLLGYGERISEKNYNFIKTLGKLDDELSECCNRAQYSKGNELLEDVFKRKESKRTYKFF